MIEVKFSVWFPDVGRVIHFCNATVCDEYDTLCFQIKPEDCTEKYKHLAGESYIPTGDFEIVECRII